jgi:CRP/FNR family transcriptional regulator, cyclic AMP receptor protein
MRRDDVVHALTSSGWLRDVDPALARAILDAGRVVSLARGDVLFRPEDEPGGMFGVAAGGILLSMTSRAGLPVPFHIVRRYSWFGFGAVLTRQVRTLRAEANEPSHLLQVPLAEAERLRASFPESRRAFSGLASRADVVFRAVINDLLIPGAHHRLAAVLLRVTESSDPASPENLQGVQLTQGLLGELANASRQTVARFVESAVRAGWIDWTYGQVRLLDRPALTAFAAERP